MGDMLFLNIRRRLLRYLNARYVFAPGSLPQTQLAELTELPQTPYFQISALGPLNYINWAKQFLEPGLLNSLLPDFVAAGRGGGPRSKFDTYAHSKGGPNATYKYTADLQKGRGEWSKLDQSIEFKTQNSTCGGKPWVKCTEHM